ncbi:MAG: GTPase ObgE [Clostridiales Family XIII bacterium]|jgi:GTP-binding protein|nr:GTPase ObgE [Clostridiales Family XIII bacterium]
MFVDVADIIVASGKGGDGAVSFRREPFVPNGGPDGGNGGKGGDVLFVADRNLRTLMDFKYKKKYKAEAGQNGMKSNKYGKKGQDLIIKVPVGTVIADAATGHMMADLMTDGARFVAAIGGKGGLGNSNFKNSVRQAPNFAEAGVVGTERSVTLELKLIADIGLIGFPNVGKSTLLSVSSAAKPRIADYHFTTLYPNLGVVELANTGFVMADIPGLIEGAASGAGLGFDFLRHVERTKALIHVVDISGSEGRKPLDDFLRINHELAAYSAKLTKKPQIVACSKTDIADPESEDYRALIDHLTKEGYTYYLISGATKQGVQELLNGAVELLSRVESETSEIEDAARRAQRLEVLPAEREADYRDICIERVGTAFVLSGKQLKKIFDSTNFNDSGSVRYLYKHLEKSGAVKRMKADGLAEGDTVRIYGFEFEYYDEERE